MTKIVKYLAELNIASAIFWLYFFGLCILFSGNFFLNIPQEQAFVQLAKSFLQGKLYFLQEFNHGFDGILVNGRYYWPEGPFPAITLMPFVLFFGDQIKQGYLMFICNLINIFLLIKIAQKITKNINTALWLSFGYIFATAYFNVGLNPGYSYFAQVVATTTLLFALNEFFYQRRLWAIGIFLAFATLTRSNLILGSLFFGIYIWYSHSPQRFKGLILLYTPIICSALLLFAYNWLRFHNPLDSGYYNSHSHPVIEANKQIGLWSFRHFPANLYYLFFKGPEAVFLPRSTVLTFPYLRANYWGMSIIFTSPIFLWIFKAPWKELLVKFAAITTLIIIIPLLGYFGIGFAQIGYRYGLDFYPFLFIMLCFALKKGISWKFKILIFISFLFNLYLVLTQGY